MAGAIEVKCGPDGAGRLQLDADAVRRLREAYRLIRQRAARRRRELAEVDHVEGPRDG